MLDGIFNAKVLSNALTVQVKCYFKSLRARLPERRELNGCEE